LRCLCSSSFLVLLRALFTVFFTSVAVLLTVDVVLSAACVWSGFGGGGVDVRQGGACALECACSTLMHYTCRCCNPAVGCVVHTKKGAQLQELGCTVGSKGHCTACAYTAGA
jgi:hypothetical protein